jgi:hypothetical protein
LRDVGYHVTPPRDVGEDRGAAAHHAAGDRE